MRSRCCFSTAIDPLVRGLSQRHVGYRGVATIPEVGSGLPYRLNFALHLRVCLRIIGDRGAHLLAGHALETREEVVHVGMREQVDRHPRINAGHNPGEVAGYPAPIVDHATERDESLARYERIRAT